MMHVCIISLLLETAATGLLVSRAGRWYLLCSGSTFVCVAAILVVSASSSSGSSLFRLGFRDTASCHASSFPRFFWDLIQ